MEKNSSSFPVNLVEELEKKIYITQTDGHHTDFSLYVNCIVTSKLWSQLKNFTGCERQVISKSFFYRFNVLHVAGSEPQRKREVLVQWSTHLMKYTLSEVVIKWSTHSVKYSFSEILIQWTTHSVNYSFSQLLIQWSTHSVKYSFS